ncbi:MAG: outer membrane protein assembly factor BamB family protein, partial [Intrasporangium sp.]|uniref:outer membrane protein assembly factor BamB family protein n=1 Tax=Intrasporangium sp. TaxID=1925024 RepID=UPI003F7CDCA4
MSTARARLAALVCGATFCASLLAACSRADTPAPSAASRPPPAASPAPTTGPDALTGWTTYHADPGRTGDVRNGPDPTPARPAWSTDLGGAVRGQPLVFHGLVIAATEDDRVVALDPKDGRVVWSIVIGEPLTDVQQVAGCGDIDPLGITGTPVIDTRSGTVYVVGEIHGGGGAVLHELVGLAVSDGHVRLRRDADPPLPAGEDPVNLLQRPGLALSSGRVYVAFGGNYADCGHYHGWVVGIDVDATT